MKSSPLGYLALLLHAHLPFVRHPDKEEVLEEDWLFEAITECYIPLLWILEELYQGAIRCKLTLSLSPTLCAMLKDPLLIQRYKRYLLQRIELCSKEIERYAATDPERLMLAKFYKERFQNVWKSFTEAYAEDILGQFKKYQEKSLLELATSSATHGYLPLLKNPEQAVNAQIFVAIESFFDSFQTYPKGFWLPECGYYPGIEFFLQSAEIRWFVLEAHGLLFSEPRPFLGLFAPIYTPSGPAAFGRDSLSSKEVWSAQEGYPGDPVYREFYWDLGFESDLEYIRPYILPTGQRKFTGIKYHRITGKTEQKALYDPKKAQERAKEHAENFIMKREEEIKKTAPLFPTFTKPILLCPFDCELFGHWWFEGPLFLKELIKKAHQSEILELTTPLAYLQRYPTQQICRPTYSSWGLEGYSKMWLNETNDFIYQHLHEAAYLLVELVRKYKNGNKQTVRSLKQAARELLLAQASDWPFLISKATAKEYAFLRVITHLNRFSELCEGIIQQKINKSLLEYCEYTDNLFPTLNLNYFS